MSKGLGEYLGIYPTEKRNAKNGDYRYDPELGCMEVLTDRGFVSFADEVVTNEDC